MTDRDVGGQVVELKAERAKRLHELRERRSLRAKRDALASLWRIREATGLYPPHMTAGSDPDEAA